MNRFGLTQWAKLVRPVPKVKRSADCLAAYSDIESQIIDKFLTPDIIEKEFAKILSDNGGIWKSKFIERLLGCTWHTFISEETFNFIKKFHNPQIDFKKLNKLAVAKVKDVKSDLFFS